ncbi:MAG: hypothetical protein V4644_01935 [Patescibacteria group bacterium]
MKELLALAALFLIVGIGSFLYRNTVERPSGAAPFTACTMEAKLCPDGSSVGRTGPSCEFAQCPEAPAEFATSSPLIVPAATGTATTAPILPR